jgi:hypothetical protein
MRLRTFGVRLSTSNDPLEIDFNIAIHIDPFQARQTPVLDWSSLGLLLTVIALWIISDSCVHIFGGCTLAHRATRDSPFRSSCREKSGIMKLLGMCRVI